MTTHIVFILDRSYSMHGKESDVIGGFNSLLEEQQKIEDEAKLTTILFDDQYEVLHKGIEIHSVKPITRMDYFVRGNTALLDAVGKTIDEIDSYVADDDNVLIIINTDGEENSSRAYTNEQIKEMVTHLQDEHNWKFIFLGAGIDSFAIGGGIGIMASFNTSTTTRGINAVYAATSNLVADYRTSKGVNLNTNILTNLTDEDDESNINISTP